MLLKTKSPVLLPPGTCPVDLIEATYQVGVDRRAWLEGLVDASGALDHGLGVFGLLQHLANDELETVHVAAKGSDPTLALLERLGNLEIPFDHLAVGPLTHSGSMREEFTNVAATETFDAAVAGIGVRDAAAHMARLGNEWFLTLVAPSREAVVATPARRRRWSRMTTHLATGLRLRQRLSELGTVAELVFDAKGRALHVEPSALENHGTTRARMSQIADGVKAVERARGALRADDAELAMSLWTALIEGRWSLADRVDSDGKRFVLAFRNELGAPGPPELSPRERDVVAWAVGGASLKEIGYAMGLAISTVGEQLKRAMHKLRVTSRGELAAMWANMQAPMPAGDLAKVALEGREDVLAGLSEAELEVARRAACGESTARIAAARGTSESTVTNQLGAIYRKLNVSSKAELAALVGGVRGG